MSSGNLARAVGHSVRANPERPLTANRIPAS